MSYYNPLHNVKKRYQSLSGLDVPSASLLDAEMKYRMNLALQEKSLQDEQEAYNRRLALETDRFNLESADRREAIKSQKDAAMTGSISNLATTGALLYGKDIIGSGASAIKGIFSSPEVLPPITQMSDKVVSGLPSAAETIDPTFGATVGSKIGQIGKPTAALGGSIGGSVGGGIGTGVGSITGSTTASATGSAIGSAIGSAVGYAAPYYALAKGGGMLINSITDNNPQYKETPFGRLGGSLTEPLAVEQYWAKEAADHGIGNEEVNEAFATMNPLEVGGFFTDTTDKVANVLTGSMYGVKQMYDAGSNDLRKGINVASGGLASISGIGSSTEETIDAGLNLATGGLYGFIEDACIIITACTNRDSEEVDITRQYRDKYLDGDQLRGYYWLAEKVVPRLNSESRIKFCKKHLVDNLIEYGSYKLGITEVKPSIKSTIVSKVFLGTIKTIGYMLPQYIRLNGEVY